MRYAKLVYLSRVKLTDKANDIYAKLAIPLTGKTVRLN
jgi:hypothetical protein